MFLEQVYQDKIVLVTGGGSGIGYAISQQLLKQGAEIYITSRKEERLQKAQAELAELGTCHYAVCDIRDIDQIQSLAKRIQEEKGRLDVLINNAGGQFPSAAEDISNNGWVSVINNNLNGTWFMTQTMAKTFFIPKKEGTIINIIANVFRGFPGMAHTGAARAGIDNFTKTLAVEWSKYNIRINAIAPGIIKSTGLKNYPPELLKGISDTIPMKRLGTVEEIAWATLFLASPFAQYITGETLYIDGGQRLHGDVFQT